MASETQPSAAALKLPCAFGRYLLLQRLGQGGMGEVYLALQRLAGIERFCVIKSLRADLVENREYVARFIDEARTVVRLTHGNICQVFDVGIIDGRYYLAMEHIEGRDLRNIMEQAERVGVRIPEPVALHILMEVLEGLEYAHRLTDQTTGAPLGIVHRDVSPHNIMVSFEGEAKVIDFGLALSSVKRERTEPGVVLGKLAYMAPEHARAIGVDGRADQFAVAMIALELLMGERYYEGLDNNAIWQVVGSGRHVPRAIDRVPSELAEILMRALSPSPAARYASCGELHDTLARRQASTSGRMARSATRELLATLFPGAAQADRSLRTTLARSAPAATSVKEPSASITIATALGMNPLGSAADISTEPEGKDEPVFDDTARNQVAPEATQRVERRRNDDVTLASPASVSPPSRAMRRPAVVAAASIALLVAAVGTSIVAVDDDDPTIAIAPIGSDSVTSGSQHHGEKNAADARRSEESAAQPHGDGKHRIAETQPTLDEPTSTTTTSSSIPKATEQLKDAPTKERHDVSQGALKETSKETLKEASKETSKETSRETPRETSKETSKQAAKETPKSIPRDPPRATKMPTETPRGIEGRVELVKQFCPDAACTKDVALRFSRLKDLDATETEILRADAGKCVDLCRVR